MGYEILQHTADYAVRFFGITWEEVFDSVTDFFKKDIVEICETEKDYYFEKSYTENISYALIEVLNEIIFQLETGNIIERITILERREDFLKCKMFFKKCLRINFKNNLKAATYHNMAPVDSSVDSLDITVVFDT